MAHAPIITLPLFDASAHTAATQQGDYENQSKYCYVFFHDAMRLKSERKPAVEYGSLFVGLSKSERFQVRFTCRESIIRSYKPYDRSKRFSAPASIPNPYLITAPTVHACSYYRAPWHAPGLCADVSVADADCCPPCVRSGADFPMDSETLCRLPQ